MNVADPQAAPDPSRDAAGEWCRRALEHHREGRLEEAERCYREALAAQPDLAEAHNNLGSVYLQLARYADAEASFRAAIAARPDFPEARYNLGIALRQGGRLEEAAQALRDALANRSEFPEAANDLGNVLRLLKQVPDAEGSFRRAIALRPDFAEAHHNLGALLLGDGRVREAEESLQRALGLKPDLPGANSNLGIALGRLGRFNEAEEAFRKALAAAPGDLRATYNLSLLRLLLGDFAGGFELFETRFEGGGTAQFGEYRKLLAKFDRLPRWRGEPLQGKGVLILFEQGLGDNLMMMRYLPLLKRRGASRVVVVCPSELVPLMRMIPEIDHVADQGVVPLQGISFHSPIMSLPLCFGTRLDSVPCEVPYLRLPEAPVRRWRERLAGLEGFRVGIAWQGSTRHPADRDRSFTLERFSGLARLPGICLISVQKGEGTEQVAGFRARFRITDAGPELHTLADTGALMLNLDLVIACDTAVVHLAGALGMPVWVALPFASEWRWMLDRSDSPWYPTMRLFRQKSLGDWAGVFAEIEAALRERTQAR